MVKKRLKYEAGAATQFISRRKARKKLQVSLADFRRLCILKGTYPHEPKNKKQVNKGSTAPRTFYFKKDIDFLAHEPLINQFREHKAIIKKLKRHRGRQDYEKAEKVRGTLTKQSIDHIVLERYPNFIDAIRDLNDALTLVFLFATFPQSRKVHTSMIQLCKKLKYEFLNYCIHTKAIRKTFISIKGIYFQAEICNETITWIVPHTHAYAPPIDVDFRVMSTFADFYANLVGFVNYQLYKRENLVYPPRCVITENDSTSQDEKLCSLLFNLVKSETEEQDELEHSEAEPVTQVFKDKVFYINREVPREPLHILIRSCGGVVVTDEEDGKINYQIVDRGASVDMKHSAQRTYLQPQWVFDCVNAVLLMPLNKYLPSSDLPAHLSPFVDEKAYKPPERMALEALQRGEDPGLIYGAEPEASDADEDAPESESDEEETPESEKEGEEEPVPLKGGRKRAAAKVSSGKKDNPVGKNKEQDDAEAKRLAMAAMPKKFKRIHQKIKYGERKEKTANLKLAEKRKQHEQAKKGKGKVQPKKKQKTK